MIKRERMKPAYLIFLLSFFLGIFLTNIWTTGQNSSMNVWNSHLLEQMKAVNISGKELFFYVFGKRIFLFLFLSVLAISRLGMAAGLLNLGWQGLSLGMLITTVVIRYGIKGILLAGGALFPQYVIYVVLYFFYLWMMVWKRRRMRIGMGDTRRRDCVTGLMVWFVFFFLYITGIFLESYVNPFFLKKLLKFF